MRQPASKLGCLALRLRKVCSVPAQEQHQLFHCIFLCQSLAYQGVTRRCTKAVYCASKYDTGTWSHGAQSVRSSRATLSPCMGSSKVVGIAKGMHVSHGRSTTP